MAISEMITRVSRVDRLKEELQKTTALCANCHRRIIAQERGWFRSKRGPKLNQKMRPERLELPTACSEDKCSVQLSYERNFN